MCVNIDGGSFVFRRPGDRACRPRWVVAEGRDGRFFGGMLDSLEPGTAAAAGASSVATTESATAAAEASGGSSAGLSPRTPAHDEPDPAAGAVPPCPCPQLLPLSRHSRSVCDDGIAPTPHPDRGAPPLSPSSRPERPARARSGGISPAIARRSVLRDHPQSWGRSLHFASLRDAPVGMMVGGDRLRRSGTGHIATPSCTQSHPRTGAELKA